MRLLKHIVALMLIVTSIALSQETTQPAAHSLEVTVDAGIVFPYLPQEFFDQVDNGIHYGAGAGLLFEPGSSGYSAIYLTLGYDYFNANDGALIRVQNLSGSQWTVSGGTTEIQTAFFEYKGTFSSSRIMLSPFFLVGVGAERFDQKDVTVSDGTTTYSTEGEQRTTFAWNIGFGFDLPVSNDIAFFNECRYILGIGAETHTQHVVLDSGIRIKF